MRFFLSIFLCTALAALSSCNTTQNKQEQPQVNVSLEKSSSELMNNAKASFIAGHYESAVKSYSAVVQKQADNYEARLGLAESHFKLGNSTQAEENFDWLLSVPEYRIEALQGVGLSVLQQGRMDEAQTYLSESVEDDESLWRSWNGLAQIYDSKKDWALAANAYDMALKYTDRSEVIYNNMGVSYMTQEKFENAAEAFENALHYKPDLEVANTNYRLALAMQDRYDEATLEHDIREEAKAFNNAGYAAMRRGDYAGAERMLLKAIEANPSFYKTAYNNLQVLYYLKNKKSKQD